MAACYYQLGERARVEQDYERALVCYEQCVTVYHDLGDRVGMLNTLLRVDDVLTFAGRRRQAAQVRERTMAVGQKVDDPRWKAFALQGLGQTAQEEGDYGRARQLYGQSLAIGREISHPRIVAWSLRGLGDAAHAAGQDGEARAFYQRSLDSCRDRENQDLVPYIQLGLARATRALGEIAEAKLYLRQVLEKALAWQLSPLALEALSETAPLYAQVGQLEQAVQVLALVRHHPQAWFETRERATRLVDEMAAELPSQRAIAAQERGQNAVLEVICRSALGFLAGPDS
jgi:tetratricopeptide (TPR) repeat protein